MRRNRGAEGDPSAQLNLSRVGGGGFHIFPELSQESIWRGSRRVWGDGGNRVVGRHVEGAWESTDKRVAPCPALDWLPDQTCKGVIPPAVFCDFRESRSDKLGKT